MRLAAIVVAILGACTSGANTVTPPPPPTAPPPPPPAAVASVAVTLNSSMLPGSTQAAAVTIRDAAGAALSGRAVAWKSSNPAVATIDGTSGFISAIALGIDTITATSEGVSGSAELTVAIPPVTFIVAACPSHIKVGDLAPCTATATRSDGSVANSPATWVVTTGPATITTEGVVAVNGNGVVKVQVTVEGFSKTVTTVGYEWTPVSRPGLTGVTLEGDWNSGPSGHSANDFPILAISCSAGVMDVHVLTNGTPTQNGTVAYSFDNGVQTLESWTQLMEPVDSLGERDPGPNAAAKALATRIAAAQVWSFSFIDIGGVEQTGRFRVTGLSAFLSPILSACPS
jgi:hypothetical protein